MKARALVALGFLAASCKGSSPPPSASVDAGAALAPPGAAPQAGSAGARAGADDAGGAEDRAEPDVVVRARAAHPTPAAYGARALRARSIGNTSVVLRLDLEGGARAAFKPDSKRGPGRFRGEVAAYRLAKGLGSELVPPAFARSFPLAELLQAAGGAGGPTGKVLAAEAVADGEGRVQGALIPWIDGLDVLPLERDPWWSRFRGWLTRGGDVPASERPLARAIGELVVFDWIEGNWDRWSGANVGFLPPTRTLLAIDNDGAFYAQPPAAALARSEKLLRGADRLPRALLEALRGLDDTQLDAALGEDATGARLLSSAARAGVLGRRDVAVRHFDERRAKLGDAEVDALSAP